jgi:glycerophosphoryl diester phosphodiesterase
MKTCFPKSLKTGEKICFKTVDSAVFDNNGVPLSDRLKDIKTDISANESNINTTNSRIDNIIANDTSTDNNTELIDMRVGYDGTTYATTGAALRGQVTDIYDSIKEIIKHTREVVPRNMNIYDAMYKHDDATMLYTDYVKFAYPTTVYVPAGYQLAVYVYDYNDSTKVYTEVANSGWTTKYPIPKNKYVIIKLKHIDGSNILETESIALMFQEEYPEILKNTTLDSIGFYDSLEYMSANITTNTFDPTKICTDKLLSSTSAMFVKAKTGYKCKVIIYRLNSDGTTYSSYYDAGWKQEHAIPAENKFLFVFAKETDTDIIYFDEFVNNFSIEEIKLDSDELTNLLRTASYTGVTWKDDGHYHYEVSANSFASALTTYNVPVTLYLDYNSTNSIAVHFPFPTDPSVVEYDSYLTKVVTIPAGVAFRLHFTNDDYTLVNLRDLLKLKMTTGILESEPNIHFKDIGHKGLTRYAPENTLISFRFAKLQGFKYVECDVVFTSDNIPVLLDGADISRSSTGTGIITNMTYAEASQYSYGFPERFGNAYANTKIPTFEEFTIFCKKQGLHPYVELNMEATQDQVTTVINIAKRVGILRNMTWISYNPTVLTMVKTADANARLGLLSYTLTSDRIEHGKLLKSATNEVFMNTMYTTLTTDMIDACIAESMPIEVNVVDDATVVDTLHPYISGATSNWMQVGKYLMRKTN